MGLKIIPLKCPNCGAKLDIDNGMDRFNCSYCGAEQYVERRGGTVVLRLVVDAIQKVQVGTDKTAAELALIRLKTESERLNEKHKALWSLHDGNRTIILIIGCAVGLGGLVTLLSAEKGDALIAACIALLVGVVLVYVSFTLRPVRELEELERQIEKTEQEIKRNQAIVNG
jgi:ribosomal protein S27AE/HAMP domain-containing protein